MVVIVDVIKEIPDDFEQFFEQFIKIFISKSFYEGNTKIEIIEIGGREEWKAMFQLLPATSMKVKFPVLFEKKPIGIEVSFDLDIELITGSKKIKRGKLAKKMLDARIDVFEAGLNNQLSMLIKMSLADVMKKPEGGSGKTNDDDPLKNLKLQFVNGEISEEEYFHKKNLLEG
ncbi:MAG: hypothetical protein KGD70_09930 [Candidatus Lokiarchaeota archaeon]|nr:hypothetical protein [Candidatus Lokiarchaeota archaeon]